MARFADSVYFSAVSSGLGDFVVNAAVQGYMTPAGAGMVNGAKYKYRAETLDLSQWEIGEGTWVSATSTLQRTTVLFNNLGTTAVINFGVAPNVGIVMLKEDTLALDEANSFTSAQKQQARANIGSATLYVQDTAPAGPNSNDMWWQSTNGQLYVWYTDANGSQWVAVTNPNTLPGAVQYDAAQSLSAAQQAQARSNIGAQSIYSKNYIVNGGMMVSQENGSTAGSASTYHPVDQFLANSVLATGTYTIAQVASATPGGSPNRIRITVTAAEAAPGATDYFTVEQRLEGLRVADLLFGAASAKAITIQFGIKAPAGTYAVSIANSALNRAYAATFTVAAGEANTDVVKSVTIPGDITGTWANDNTTGIRVRWGMLCGSTLQTGAGAWAAGDFRGATGQSNLFATNGNVFELFDVGLYQGSAAASTFVVPDFDTEFRACLRYYEKSYDYNVAPAAANRNGMVSIGICFDGTNKYGAGVQFKRPKRTTPTTSVWDGAGTANASSRYLNGAYTDGVFTGGSVVTNGYNGFVFNPNATANNHVLIHYVANARM